MTVGAATGRTPAILVAVVVSLGAVAAAAVAQRSDAPRNDLPQPYRTTRDWGELPPGVTWAAVTAVEPAPDGTIYVIHRCFANSCAGRGEAPILHYNANGRLLKAFGERLFVFPHGATVDGGGNLWVTDARGENGKGHQVIEFNPEGRVLRTLGQAGVSGSTTISSISRPTSSSRRPATSSSPTAIAMARTTASSGSRKTGVS